MAFDAETWRRYLAATADRPVHPLFDDLAPHLPARARAIDLGCGAGRGTVWLAERGYRVTAVDVSADALAYVRERIPAGADVELIESNFADLTVEPVDVAVACFSLFFLPRDQFNAFWSRLVDAIEPGGLFAGEFLGERDDWSDVLTTHARADAEALLSGFDVLSFREEEQDGQTALGDTKHWHVFHAVARKRGL